MEKDSSTINRAINLVFKGTIILLPLFFLPFNLLSDGMDSFGKSFLLYVSTFILIILLVYKKQKNNDKKYKMSYLGYLLLFFVVVLSASGIFGIYPRNSFFGDGGMTLSILNYICFFLLYFFTINYVKNEKRVKGVVKSLILSYAVSVWTVFLAFLLKWLSVFDSSSEIFSVLNAQNGSFEDFSIFLSIMSIFILGAFVHKTLETFSHVWLVKITWIVSLFLLVQINFIPAWFLMIASLLLFVFTTYKSKLKIDYDLKYLKRVTALLFLLASVMLLMNFTFTGQSSVLKKRQAANFQLDLVNSKAVVLQSFKDNPILGQGGENYKIAFSKYRDSGMNALPWWDKRFKKSFSYICDIAVATGFLGFLSFLLIISSTFFYYMKMLQSVFHEKNETRIYFLNNVFLLLIFIIFSFFFHSTNINLLFIFFIILGTTNFFIQKYNIKGPKFSDKLPKSFFIKESSEKTFMIGLVALFVLSLLILSYRTKAVFALMNYENSLKATDIETKEKLLARANNLDPKKVDYKIALSRFYKDKFDKLVSGKEKINHALFEEEMNLSIVAGKNAITLAPNSVVAYELLGVIYRDIAQFSSDSNILSATAFEKASELEPTNPLLLLELAKLYSDAGKNEDARTVSQKALIMKEDFFEARLFLSRLMIETGEFDKALNELSDMEGGYNDVDVKFEIGRVYFNQKNYMRAKEKFLEVVKLNPNYSNALYSLALSFERLNRRSEALVYYKKVLNLNPDNADIRKKVVEFGDAL